MGRTPRIAKRKTSTKRKRKDESEDEHESDQSENEQVTVASEQSEDEQSEAEEPSEPSSSEDEAFHDDEKDEDFEPPKPRTSRKKSTTKKTTTKKKDTTTTTPRKKKLKTGTSTTTKKTKTSGESKGKKKGSKKKDDIIEEDMVVVNEDKDSMFASVRKESSAIREIVDNWQESFDSDKSKATAELLTFLLHSSGAKGETEFAAKKLKVVESSKMEKVIDDLIEELPTSLQVYPIINNHPSLKHFRKNFADFWDTFVDVTKEGSQLYEKIIQEKFMNWLFLMTSSTCRALRHTSTLAAYRIASSAIDARRSEAKTLAKLEKQAKAAKNKKKETELLDLCEEHQDKTNTLEKICKDIFSQIFVKRYRDSCPDIRALSLLQGVEWVIGLPEQFLNDSSLKFFGWMLNDTEESVRKVAVQVLDKIYSKKDWKDQLNNFTLQFLPRIISVTRDVSVSVSVEGIKLLTTLLQNGYLKANHIEEVSKLMFSEVSSVRFYAAKFAYTHIKSKSDSSKSKKSKKSDVSLKDVLEFVSESVEEFPMAPYYVVDSWWSLDSDIFRSYKQICQMINDEEGDAITLIKILNASIQKLKGSLKSVTSSSDNVKVNTKSKLTTKEVEEEVEEITGILAPYLSGLIDKYRTEPEIVAELIEIPQHLDMDNYAESHFTKLLKSLKETLNTNISPTVYLQIAKTFKYLIKDHEDFSLRSEATLQYNEIIREMSSQLKDAVQTLHEQDEPTADVLSTLHRIRAFTKVVGTSQLIADEVLFEDMNIILESKISEIEMSQKDDSSSSEEEVDEVTPIIIDIIQDDLFWTLKDSLEEKGEPRAKLQKKYLTKQEKITTPLFYVLKKGKIGSSIILHCFNHLMNIYMITCADNVGSDTLIPLTTNDRVEILRRFFTKSMKHLTKEYILNSVSDEENVDEDEKKKKDAKIKVINQTVSDLILGLSRAIICKSLPDTLIPDILSYFVKTKIPIVEDVIKKFHADIKHRFESKLWEYEFGALKVLHSAYLDYVEQEEEKSIIKKASKDLEELGSRISKSHFPGKDVKHLESLVTHTINFIFDDINQYHSFLTGLMKFRFKGLSDAKRSEFVKSINRKLDQIDDIDKKAKENVESFIELLEVKKKKGDETEDEKTDNEKDKMEDEEEEEEKKDEEEEKEEEKKDDKMEDDDNTQISETKENEEDEELISSKPRSSL
ncbi:predicted protein [Naegleria gruberi]|uniref:Predicted protein n=1 Tax=Naegleria gruberi TaxID=5762 RepID=D2VQE3_NAEGR|nr:uncharacterized protein NAEGRDRAFT_51437 [Naegleria gruberi]EFC40859.1 predicted protein [Naegleria gruberi]|eukprot:XP_002673603.1 predicted protein [Naegleria gruberi strain NEG-M]